MQLPVMGPTERDNELIAHLSAQCRRLRKAQVVRVARLASANDTGLGRDKPPVRFIAQSECLWRKALAPGWGGLSGENRDRGWQLLVIQFLAGQGLRLG